MKKIGISLLVVIIMGITLMIFLNKNSKSNQVSECNSLETGLSKDESTEGIIETNPSEAVEETEAIVVEYDKYYIDEDIKDYANPTNKDAYQKIYDAVDKIEKTVDVSTFEIDDKEAENLGNAILDRATYEFFYLKNIEFNKEKKSFEFQYWTDKSKTDAMKLEFDKKIEHVVNDIVKPEPSDIEKEFRLFEYLSEYSQYENSENVLNSGVYGILVNGKGICGDYANTIKYILNQVGLECHIVTVKTDFMFHAFNEVKIDGKYYYVDASASKTKLLERFNFTEDYIRINFAAKEGEFYWGNSNFKKIKPAKADSDRFEFLRKAVFYTLDEGWVYYCNYGDNGKIYKSELKNGENAKVLSEDETNGMVVDGDYLYYVNRSDSDYLYRIKKDGTDRKLIDNTISITFLEKQGDKLYYTDDNKEITKDLPIK